MLATSTCKTQETELLLKFTETNLVGGGEVISWSCGWEISGKIIE